MDRNSPDELMKAYSSMQEMYRAYLEVGLSSKKEKISTMETFIERIYFMTQIQTILQ